MAAAAENLVCWHIQYLVSTYLQCLVSGVSTVSAICITFGGQPTLALVRVTWSMHFQTTCIHPGSWFLMVYVFRYFYCFNMHEARQYFWKSVSVIAMLQWCILFGYWQTTLGYIYACFADNNLWCGSQEQCQADHLTMLVVTCVGWLSGSVSSVQECWITFLWNVKPWVSRFVSQIVRLGD